MRAGEKRSARDPSLAHRELPEPSNRAGLRTRELVRLNAPSNDAFPCVSTVASNRSKNSLTVAGAVPALLLEQRTGFPFHPSGQGPWDTRNR
jgi:hypothetical protein